MQNSSDKDIISHGYYTEERPLFGACGIAVRDTVFAAGESPLKESRDITLENSIFKWKYPLWYSQNIAVKDCTWLETARAGVWYTERLTAENCLIEAPKNFRRCSNLTLKKCSFSNAGETLWNCSDVTVDDVTAVNGDYFGMNCGNVRVSGLTLYGNYSFDGAKNVEIRGSKLLSKDAFWNSENITVYDTFIAGEYLGWNSKNLTLINCTVESLQGMCYAENLVMKNCTLINTTLAFEYSTVDAEIVGKVDSVFNPKAGRIKADCIGALTMDKSKIDPAKTEIICADIGEECL